MVDREKVGMRFTHIEKKPDKKKQHQCSHLQPFYSVFIISQHIPKAKMSTAKPSEEKRPSNQGTN